MDKSMPVGTIWVESDVAIDGTYVVSLHYGEDQAWTLDRDTAISHAVATVAQAERAEFDAAVFRFLVLDLGMDSKEATAFIVKDLRPDRPELDTKPMNLIPSVSADKFEPYLTIELDGKPVGSWSPADARQHAGYLLSVIEAVNNDSQLYNALRESDFEDPKARSVISRLVKHREAFNG